MAKTLVKHDTLYTEHTIGDDSLKDLPKEGSIFGILCVHDLYHNNNNMMNDVVLIQ